MAIEPGPTARRRSGSPTACARGRCASLLGWIVGAASLAVRGVGAAGHRARHDRRRVRGRRGRSRCSTRSLPPMLAALRLPFMVAIGFLLVLLADAWLLLLAAELLPDDIRVDGFGDALLAALVIAAVSIVAPGHPRHQRRRRVRAARHPPGRRAGRARTVRTDVPGIIFLEIDGLALPVLRDAMRDGNAPTMARWIAEHGYRLIEWETDLSSQTGASQAGILLGSNDDIPAFRWVEKETGRLIVCSSPADCAEIERPPRDAASGCSPTAARAAATCCPARPTRRSSPSAAPRPRRRPTPATAPSSPTASTSRARFVLFFWEIVLEVTAALRASPPRRAPARPSRRHLSADARGDVRDRPRPDRLRGADRHDARPARGLRDVRELRRGRPPLRARARRHARGAAQARPAVRAPRARAALRPAPVRDRRALRPRADAGRDVQAAQRLRARRARRALARPRATWSALAGGDEQDAMVKHAVDEATGRSPETPRRTTSPTATWSCSARATSA